jgi:hypothetical protein
MLLHIDGATTDLHYTTDIIREDSEEKALPEPSVARHVFTDLAIVASREQYFTAVHPRLYDLLSRINRRCNTILVMSVAFRVVDPFLCGEGDPRILIDRRYQIWVDGITWSAIR